MIDPDFPSGSSFVVPLQKSGFKNQILQLMERGPLAWQPRGKAANARGSWQLEHWQCR